MLDDLLRHVTIDSQTMNGAHFVGIGNDTPGYYEWFDNCERFVASGIKEQDDDDRIPAELPAKITEATEMIRKLHISATNIISTID